MKRVAFILFVLMIAAMMGCQATPEEDAVTSKNDGAFEAALEVTEAGGELSEVTYSHQDSFTNTEGTVCYSVALEEVPVLSGGYPVLQVKPHTITADEARQMAEAFFGDAEIYEYSNRMSREEIETVILQIKQVLSNKEEIMETDVFAEENIALQEERLEQYEKAYALAVEGEEEVPCEWSFHPESYYDSLYTGEAASETEGYTESEWLMATAERDGRPYIFKVCNRDEADYRMHNITCEVNQALVSENVLYGTSVPTDEEMQAAQTQAEQLIEQFGIGDWVIASCEVQTRELLGMPAKYTVVVTACPVYDGIALTHQKQLQSLRTEDAFASNYYYTELVFTFSKNALISFCYQAPLDVVKVLNDSVATLSCDDALERFKLQMQTASITADADDFVVPTGAASKKVDVDEMELGLVRTRIKNNAAEFYLVPAYTFRGSYVLLDDAGEILLDSRDLEGKGLVTRELCVINAVDGSVINVELGY